MWGIFRGLFRRRRRADAVFYYWDGKKERSIDPVVAWKGIVSSPIDVDAEYKFASAELEENDIGGAVARLESTEKLVSVVRDVFGVEAFDSGGLTINETIEVMAEFFEFIGSLKKSTKPSPTASQPTELSMFETSPKKSGKRSFSFGTESNGAEPSSSSKQSEAPSAAT